MKFRDNIAVFSTAMTGLSLEVFIFLSFWQGRGSWERGTDPGHFLLVGQIYLIAACATTYFAGRYFMKPLEAILEGITEYGKGKFQRRIPPSRVKELDQISQHLNHMASELQALDGLKNDLIANVSHELRSPMAAMENYAALLLQERGFSDQSRENLSRLRVNLSRLRHLVENLLDISRIETRQVLVEPEVLSIKELTQEVCALFATLLGARNIRLEISIPESLPNVYADAAKVRQILTNLVDNGIKYNVQGGKVGITASVDSESVYWSIRDTGPGMDPGQMANLFERFRRLPAASMELAKVKGVGLGLAISRGLARAMGGDIRVESRLGIGSTFTLSLPGAWKYGTKKDSGH